jgi:hypothetical protein
MPALTFKLVGVFLLLSSLPGCSDRREASRDGRKKVADSSGGTVALGLDPKRSYRPGAMSASGAIDGTITLAGVPRDSVVPVTRDPKVCGDSASVAETQSSSGSTLANALVWVEGITSGKPLPEVRRETLTIERCRFDPRVMTIVSGSTINVLSRDRAVHDARFYREGVGEPVERIHTVDAGQVVPSEKIASAPGIVEVRCGQHPWARAYIAVFDHPYFAVTDDKGDFKIDSLPPGTYTVKVWHEQLAKPMEQRLVVRPGGVGRLDLSLALR